MRRWALAGALFLFLVVAVVASAPARLLPLLLPAGQVQMQGLAGTVWEGSASRCLLRTPAGYLQLGRVEWRLHPLSLLALAPTVEVRSQWGEQHASGTVTLYGQDEYGLSDVDARIDASLLRQLAPVAVDGQFALIAPRLHVAGGLPVGAEGRLVWEHGAWAAPQGRMALGTYAVDFAQPGGKGQALTGKVLTLAGPVRAEGSVRLVGRAYNLDVSIAGDHGLDPALAQALSLMARPTDKGFQLKLDGEL